MSQKQCNKSAKAVASLTKDICSAFDNVHKDAKSLAVVLAGVKSLSTKGVNTGNAVDSIAAQIDEHCGTLHHYYKLLKQIRDELQAKAAEVDDTIWPDGDADVDCFAEESLGEDEAEPEAEDEAEAEDEGDAGEASADEGADAEEQSAETEESEQEDTEASAADEEEEEEPKEEDPKEDKSEESAPADDGSVQEEDEEEKEDEKDEKDEEN